MTENGDDVNTRNTVSGRRTRSQAAPEWTVTESLILVNEIAAVEADCSVAISSYQQWEIIAGNCAALDVGRNLPQCRRKWQALLAEYEDVMRKSSKSKKIVTKLEPELFEAIERVVKAREERGDLHHESDDEDGNEDLDATVEIGSIKKRQQSKSWRYRAQKPKRCRRVESSKDLDEKQDQRPEENHEEESENNNLEEEFLKDFLEQKSKLKCNAKRRQNRVEKRLAEVELHENLDYKKPKPSLAEVELHENLDYKKPKPSLAEVELHENLDNKKPKPSLAEVELHENLDNEKPKLTSVGNLTISREENEEILNLKLQELAIEIEVITTESADCKAGNSQNIEDYRTEFTRRQGDKLIATLGNFSSTLKQLCDLLQECK